MCIFIYGDKVTKKRAKSKAKRHFFSPSTAVRGIAKRPMGHSPSPHREFEVLSVGISTRTYGDKYTYLWRQVHVLMATSTRTSFHREVLGIIEIFIFPP